jgi:SAM-dependent methyltransferase
MIGIDLGCGRNKQPGLIGVDRYLDSGIDLVADIDKPLPFRDDSVDFIFASHVLEHVENLLATIKEVYRICRHGAQMCVVAPYSEQKLNHANPYHRWNFNEHTPRFWTHYEKTPISPEEYCHPQAQDWGLSRSDNSDPGIDIRLVRIEYFYFPLYAQLSPDEQRRSRLERPDVCDQIMYHLIVWKSAEENPAKSFDEYVADFRPYEPEYIPALRSRAPDSTTPDNMDALFTRMMTILNSKEFRAVSGRGGTASEDLRANGERQLSFVSAVFEAAREASLVEERGAERLRPELTAAKSDANELRAQTVRLTREITRLHEHCAAQSELLARRTAELHDAAAYNRILRDQAARTARDLDFARVDLRRQSDLAAAAEREVSMLSERVRELESNRESSEVLRAKLGLTRAELETTATLLALQRQKEDALTSEVAAAKAEAVSATQQAQQFRGLWGDAVRAFSVLSNDNRIPEFVSTVRVGGFLLGRHRRLAGLPQEFASLRAYTDQHFASSRASVILGGDLNNIPYREYVIPFALERLASVTAAVRPFLPDSSGELGVEIVSDANEILAHVRQHLRTVSRSGLVTVQLPIALSGLNRGWSLRVFARDAIAPVGLYELARGALLRANVRYFPFVLFS